MQAKLKINIKKLRIKFTRKIKLKTQITTKVKNTIQLNKQHNLIHTDK